MKQDKLVIGMAEDIMKKGVEYTRRELTIKFWEAYPLWCAKKLIKSPVNDRTPIEVLEGIISFEALKVKYNRYIKG